MNAVIGIKIGGAQLLAGVVLSDGQVLSLVSGRIDPVGGAASARQTLPVLVEGALQEAKLGMDQIVGMGAGFAGVVDTSSGRAVLSPHVAGWDGFPLAKWLQGQYRVPLVVQNDADAAGFGEALVGAGRGASRVLYLVVASGIGGSWIVDGVIDDGQGLGAAEIGHSWVPYPGSRAMTELERVASGRAIGRRARAALDAGAASAICEAAGGRLARVSARQVLEAARAGDSLARTLVAETCDALAMGLGNAINIYHPNRVVIGGASWATSDLFMGAVREQAERYVFEPFADSYEIVPGELGDAAVVVGASLLAWRAAGGEQ